MYNIHSFLVSPFLFVCAVVCAMWQSWVHKRNFVTATEKTARDLDLAPNLKIGASGLLCHGTHSFSTSLLSGPTISSDYFCRKRALNGGVKNFMHHLNVDNELPMGCTQFKRCVLGYLQQMREMGWTRGSQTGFRKMLLRVLWAPKLTICSCKLARVK